MPLRFKDLIREVAVVDAPDHLGHALSQCLFIHVSSKYIVRTIGIFDRHHARQIEQFKRLKVRTHHGLDHYDSNVIRVFND